MTAKNDPVTLVPNPHCGMDLPDPSTEPASPESEIFSEDSADLSPEPETLAEESETLEAQLDRLSKAITRQTELDHEEGPINLENKGLLEQQIAEDRALGQAIEDIVREELLAEETATMGLEPAADQSEADAVEGDPGVTEPLSMDLAEIQSCLEALLFISDKPLSLEKLKDLLGSDFDNSLFETALQTMMKQYAETRHGIELVEIGGGYQFRTKPGRSNLAQKLVRTQTQRLSSGAMETLAIIAYKQPTMKEEIDKIRGVDSSYFLRGLLDRNLVKISGRSELPGRPMLYSTTPEFLEVFGIKDLSVLPSLRELEQAVPGSQTANPEDEDPKTREMRRMVAEMKSDKQSALYYNPKEDEKILKDIRERISSIPVSTPYLDELKTAETLAQKQAQGQPELLAEPSAP